MSRQFWCVQASVSDEGLEHRFQGAAVRELEEALDVRERYEHVEPAAGQVVVHDSEGAGAGRTADRSGSPDGSRED